MTNSHTLERNEEIDSKFRILLFIKKSGASETYRVKANAGGVYFMKTYNYSSLHPTDLTLDKNILEIEIVKKLNSENLVEFKDSGYFIKNGRKYAYLILKFISGETILERQIRQSIASVFELKRTIVDVLNGLKSIHELSPPVVHNDITPQNVMLDLSGVQQTAKIIDFGFAREFECSGISGIKPGINPWYSAPETIHGAYSPQSDLFSVGALMYHILYGAPPWFDDATDNIENHVNRADAVIELRLKPLPIPNIDSDFVGFDKNILKVMQKALSSNIERRYQTADAFINALDSDEILFDEDELPASENSRSRKNKHNLNIVKGDGFKAIAGMHALKEQLKHDVIYPLENPEEYQKHGLNLPNGMLLYGPPGCGKTFFAERFAEEAGYNFIKVIASDLASIYIHGSQEKISALFRSAREAAPAILYFDELDAMIPNRDNLQNQSLSGEVNEFLSQLDNIGKSNVFVIGSTNKPDLIDRAAIRSGRLEKWFYIPPPDFAARVALFELYLIARPCDFDLDYEDLARKTDNYVSSDIKFIIDEASRMTIRFKRGRLTMETLNDVINSHKPTVPFSELQKYEAIRKKMESEVVEETSGFKNPFGFKP